MDNDWASKLRLQAEKAVAEADRQREEAYRPECLTLYLNNECNLRCAYCYSAPSPEPSWRLSLETIAAAAELVAESCREKKKHLYAVFQGGGEPTLDSSLLDATLDVIDGIAEKHGVEVYRYLATNGVIPEKRAVQVAKRFDLVGLSCDGTPDIHDAQRPDWGGLGSSSTLERTAHILREEGQQFHLRATITSISLSRQAEIAEYLCLRLGPAEIVLEPVYLGGRANAGLVLNPHQASEFVGHYLEAVAVSRRYGVKLSTSGSRVGEIHGPFCNLFRQVLQLVPGPSASTWAGPGGLAAACFKSADAERVREHGTTVGWLGTRSGRFEIDNARVRALRERLSPVPEKCKDCFNRYHCAGECPDRCLLVAGHLSEWGTGFRCQIQKTLTATLLEQEAERLWSEVLANRIEGPHGSTVS
jgi:uncharacterized protein